ncbi:ERF family protein [Fuscovulum ytuae]|uniref:ERF family protein n=1 Tax=Fuscovulum ytuae TaxID=3042299 RepID=A0ABY8Q6T5_9RHOB|nr:ERF family protein [Fuscovulum sp. YMD61]WGV15917.1 ERF family protein [Fuscovulum sp. YMD61]
MASRAAIEQSLPNRSPLNQAPPNQLASNQTLFPKAQVLGAVVLAKSKIRRLTKADRNLEEAYAFTSIDCFLEHINPICVEAGLVILMDEVAVADGGSGAWQGSESWLRITYDITLAHISGETLGPFRRHVDIARSGPQAFGAAQSYVLKQFLRAQFQIATGEADDPDFGTKPAGRASAPAPAPAPAPARAEIQAPRSDRVEADDHAMEIMALRTCAQRVAEAATGRKLLSILAGLADEMIAHPILRAARLQALSRIVATAPSVAALEKLEQHFAGDWAHVADEAAHRRSQLDLLDSLAEEELVAEAAREKREVAASGEGGVAAPPVPDLGDPALNAATSGAPGTLKTLTPAIPAPSIPDAFDFGDIPYHEAAE